MFWKVCTVIRWTILWVGTFAGVAVAMSSADWSSDQDEQIAMTGAIGGLVGFGVAYVVRLMVPKKAG